LIFARERYTKLSVVFRSQLEVVYLYAGETAETVTSDIIM